MICYNDYSLRLQSTTSLRLQSSLRLQYTTTYTPVICYNDYSLRPQSTTTVYDYRLRQQSTTTYTPVSCYNDCSRVTLKNVDFVDTTTSTIRCPADVRPLCWFVYRPINALPCDAFIAVLGPRLLGRTTNRRSPCRLSTSRIVSSSFSRVRP